MTLCKGLRPWSNPEGPIRVKTFDPTLASPFRLEWLVPTEPAEDDDIGRAVAEKAEAILRAARFLDAQRLSDEVDMEVRLWIQGARASACVSITWEPGAEAFGFYVLDESLRERLAVIVFDELPCMGADDTLGQADAILEAALESLYASEKSIRIPVLEGRDP